MVMYRTGLTPCVSMVYILILYVVYILYIHYYSSDVVLALASPASVFQFAIRIDSIRFTWRIDWIDSVSQKNRTVQFDHKLGVSMQYLTTLSVFSMPDNTLNISFIRHIIPYYKSTAATVELNRFESIRIDFLAWIESNQNYFWRIGMHYRQLWGTGARTPLNFQLFLFFRWLQSHTNSDIRLHVVAYPVKQYTCL